MATARKPNGAAAAALLSAGVGVFTIGLMTTLAQLSGRIAYALEWWGPAGSLTGETGMGVTGWLAAWLFLHTLYKNREVDFSRNMKWASILVVLGLLGTFPPVFHSVPSSITSLSGFPFNLFAVAAVLSAALLWLAYFARLNLIQKSLERQMRALGVKDIDDINSPVQRIPSNAAAIARAMHLPKSEVETIRLAAMVHDLGKVGIPAAILRKPGPLSDEEWKIMRRHPVIGEEMLKGVELLSKTATIVRHHHEHYDGSGYPDGLKGEDIPLGSRIIMVANAFDMMISNTPFRQARSKNEALQELREHAGSQFDPKVVRAFETLGA